MAMTAALPAQSPKREARRRLALEQELLDTEKQLTAVLLRGDLSAIERIYADDYISVDPDGILGEKASGLKGLESGEIKFISIVTDEVAVHVYKTTAVVTGRAAVHARIGGAERSEQLRFMHVLLKRHRRWLLAAQQLTRIARPL
jgi:ketosteroid isomerase-like protein